MNTRSRPQAQRLVEYKVDHIVDLHCHILPAVDDGPRSLPDALALAHMLVDEGITDVVATPHMLGRFDGTNSGQEIRNAVVTLQRAIIETQIPLTIHAGGEVRLDERIGKLLSTDKILPLGDARTHLLLELPTDLMIDPTMIIPMTQSLGLKVILAHVERYDAIRRDPKVVAALLSAGIWLQVNASSLVEDSEESDAAWRWLAAGQIAVVASDAHSIGKRRPLLTAALEETRKRCGKVIARSVFIDNPIKVLKGLTR